MKFITIIDPSERRQAVEDQIIAFWKKRGVDHDNVEFFEEIKFPLVGDHALSADKLERSLNVLHDRTSISLEKDFDTEGSLFEVFGEYLASESDARILGTISYSRGFELNCNRTLAKKIGKAGGMRFLELFPCFVCSRDSTQPEMWFFCFGVAGSTLKCWKSNEVVEDFGKVLESKIVPSEHWRNGNLEWREMEGGRGPLISMAITAHYGNKAIQEMLVEIEQNIIYEPELYTEYLTLFGDRENEFYAKRAELINRLFRESALPADKIVFGLAASSIHELREAKDEVIGTVFEMLEFPLISSLSKGVRFSAKRVFENDRFLIRMKLAGKEGPCRTLLKEMEEELAVEIKIESCK